MALAAPLGQLSTTLNVPGLIPFHLADKTMLSEALSYGMPPESSASIMICDRMAAVLRDLDEGQEGAQVSYGVGEVASSLTNEIRCVYDTC